MAVTRRLGLPLIDQGQAMKHITHNEALAQLDGIVQLSALSIVTSPPATPGDDAIYIVGNPATGSFATHEKMIALYQNGGFSFVMPRIGWRCFVQEGNWFLVFNGTAWVDVVGSRDRVQRFGINTDADDANKFAVNSSNILFTATPPTEGGAGDLRVKLNKAAAPNTASILYQSNWSGRAEMGLMGDDQFRFKVSVQGSEWKEAMVIDPATAFVQFTTGITTLKVSFTQFLNTATLGADGPLTIKFQRGRSGISNTKTAVLDQDVLGQMVGFGFDGSHFIPAASVTFRSDTNAQMYGIVTGKIGFNTSNGTVNFPFERLSIDAAGRLHPAQDNSYTLGHASARWLEIFAVGGVSSVSDEREKTDVEFITDGLNFVRALRPVSYRWKIADRTAVSDTENVDRPGRRKHLGLIAQQVKSVLDEQGFDCGLYTYDPAADRHGLRYDQLLAPVIKAIQELDARFEDLSRRLTIIGHSYFLKHGETDAS
jgi:hypothetical protein